MSGALNRIALLAVTVLVLLGLTVAPPALATGSTQLYRVAVIGDSYTNGTDLGGIGQHSWPVLAWTALGRQGLGVTADVAAEGRAGYGVRGDHGSVFGDLTLRAVRPDDALVVFFGSRNDQGVDQRQLAQLSHDAFATARRIAPNARMLVIGPPWPTAAVPPAIWQIRDTLKTQALAAGASFLDPLAARWFVDRPDLIGSDGVHPTDAGHGYLADKIGPVIAAQLPGRI
ncbi:MAG: SGNH/GDSL hydrolase family protein [Mycobacterium sp.]|nr:SGNH/GDSL hydrolase family protein [Mycobacterium sp.]